MKNLKKLSLLAASAMMLLGVTSCSSGGEGGGVTTDNFVDALVKKYNLRNNNDGVYTYLEDITDHGFNYKMTLTCTYDSDFKYTFESNLVRTIDKDGVTGSMTSQIKFIWGRFESSLFNGLAHFESGDTKDDVQYIFFGLVFANDGTLTNTCNTYTIDGVKSDFNSFNVLNSTWDMTRLQVSKLNTIAKEAAGCYLW
jgi:hypothetical protein